MFELREILPKQARLAKRGRCAEGQSVKIMFSKTKQSINGPAAKRQQVVCALPPPLPVVDARNVILRCRTIR